MKRRFWAVLLTALGVLCMAFALAACGETGNTGSTGNHGSQEQQQPGGQSDADKHVHNMTEYPQQDATCTAEGRKAYWHCDGCNKDYLDKDGNEEAGDLTIEKLEHTPEEFVELQPTCEEYGKKYTRCSVCHTPLSGEEKIPKREHDWSAWEYNNDAKCGVDGTETQHCLYEDCHATETQTKEGTALEHDYDENGVCRRDNCGDRNGPKDPSSEKPVIKDGKVLFGSYPQTEVKESELKNTLTSQAGTLPTSTNAGKWKDYGYYLEGSVQSYMWYQDVSYDGEKYRGVYFTSYRPYYTTFSSSTSNSCQGDNGYKTNTMYWFRYEPIEWRVLEQKNGTALLMANIILDSQQYYHNTNTRSGGKTIYPNNYAESDIRAWLRETFYETAFDEYAKFLIEATEVDNSAASTVSSSNPYVCENTQDKVFLLSYRDVVNASYGFSSSDSTDDTARQLKSTDYAKSQGVYVNHSGPYAGNGWWWLRSPDYYNSYDADGVDGGGFADYSYDVSATSGGVVPALRIRLS